MDFERLNSEFWERKVDTRLTVKVVLLALVIAIVFLYIVVHYWTHIQQWNPQFCGGYFASDYCSVLS